MYTSMQSNHGDEVAAYLYVWVSSVKSILSAVEAARPGAHGRVSVSMVGRDSK